MQRRIRRAAPLALLLASGCNYQVTLLSDGGSDAATPDGRVYWPPRPPDAAVRELPPGAVVCGGAVCAEGWECCLRTLQCFHPGDRTACALPADREPGACASNADCAAGELCERIDDPFGPSAARCGGAVGRCAAMRDDRSFCGWSPVCGCDGRTYADPCEASRAGVRVSWGVACGEEALQVGVYHCDASAPVCPDGRSCDFDAGHCVPDRPFIACGIDSQCPEGSYCCGVLGACLPRSCVDCCFVPPPGTALPCRTDADCAVLEPAGYGAEPTYYCDGEGCGTAGGCRPREPRCDGILEPVCGCDGRSYTSACTAHAAGVRVAHEGPCP